MTRELEILGRALDALRKLADACDTVGIAHFDTDTMDDDVEAMQKATMEARAILQEMR